MQTGCINKELLSKSINRVRYYLNFFKINIMKSVKKSFTIIESGLSANQLSHIELATVMGGACGGDACAGAACGGYACGGNACAGNACGANACGANACAIQLCPVDACFVDACLIDLFVGTTPTEIGPTLTTRIGTISTPVNALSMNPSAVTFGSTIQI
jgi:hypothetical protein